MNKEDKKLLLEDLCARLPYGIKCYYNSPEIDDDVQDGISVIKGFQNEGALVEIESGDVIDIDYVKPYLRPMSSMTKEEKKELSVRYVWSTACGKIQIRYHSEGYWDNDTECPTEEYLRLFGWLNEHHFDYRGLIPKGLVLEAPEDMYKF